MGKTCSKCFKPKSIKSDTCILFITLDRASISENLRRNSEKKNEKHQINIEIQKEMYHEEEKGKVRYFLILE